MVADAFGPAAAILAGFSVDVGDRLTGWVAASRQPILNSDASLDLGGRQEGNEPRLLTCMSVPLVAGETLVGVLSLYSAEAEGVQRRSRASDSNDRAASRDRDERRRTKRRRERRAGRR